MKLTFTFFSFLAILTFQKSNGQVPFKEWDFRFGGSAYDYLQSLQQTEDGGYILGGYSYSGISGDKSQSAWGSSDYWIVKTNFNGQKEWDARFGGSGSELLTSIKQANDGGYILGGYTDSGISGDKTQASYGLNDYWIVKTNVNGQKQWDARFGGSSPEVFKCLELTNDGGYILGGWSLSGISGNKTQDEKGLSDYWIVKIDANGQKQWDASFGGSKNDRLTSIEQTLDGGYILGGTSDSELSGDKTQSSQGLDDYWIVKTDANGQKQWDARFGASNKEYLFCVKQATDGGYILGGYSASGIGGDKTQAGQGNYDYWIVKTDANGVKEWDARFGGSDYEELFSLDLAADGGYVLGGYSRSGVTGDKTQPSNGGPDYWIVKVDSYGLKQWDIAYGASSDELLYSLQQTVDGGYISGGISLSGISGDKTQPSQGGMDYWIVKTAISIAPCSIPQNLSSDGITSNQVSIIWDIVNGAVKYKVRYKPKNTSEWIKVITTNNNFDLSELTSSTEYAWQVKAICTYDPINASEWSEKLFFTTSPPKLEDQFSNSLTDMNLLVSLYPNPVNEELNIQLSDQCNDASIYIYDMQGKLILTPQMVEYSQVKINTSHLLSGFYTVKIIDNEKGISKAINFVKEE